MAGSAWTGAASSSYGNRASGGVRAFAIRAAANDLSPIAAIYHLLCGGDHQRHDTHHGRACQPFLARRRAGDFAEVFWRGFRVFWYRPVGGAVIAGGGESAPLALAFALLAPLSYGLALNYLRIFDGMDRTVLTAWALLVGASVMVPIAATATGAPQISQAETWVALGVIGFVLTAAAFIILFWLIPKVGGTAASTVTFIAPVAALLLGVLVLEETVLPIQYAGLAAIFGGLVFIDGRLFRWSRKDQPLG